MKSAVKCAALLTNTKRINVCRFQGERDLRAVCAEQLDQADARRRPAPEGAVDSSQVQAQVQCSSVMRCYSLWKLSTLRLLAFRFVCACVYVACICLCGSMWFVRRVFQRPMGRTRFAGGGRGRDIQVQAVCECSFVVLGSFAHSRSRTKKRDNTINL